MQENVNIPDSTITTNLSFRQLVLMNMQQLTNFPYIEKDFDALTDYELLCLVVKFLNDVIANQNEQNASITRMYESFLALQDYVNNTKDELEDAFNNLDDYVRNYFDNLDVQEEINNKLDQMLEDGVLEQIIEQFLQSTALWCFNNVESMKQATNLINGSYAKTLGYYSANDGGESTYKIRTKTNEDVVDEKKIIQLHDTNLVAVLNVKNDIKLSQLGASISALDCSSILSYAILNFDKIYIDNEYKFVTPIEITTDNKEIYGYGQNLSYNGTGTFITITNSNVIRLHDFDITCNSNSAINFNGTSGGGCVDCSISNMKIYNAVKGITSAFTWDCSFRDIRIQSSTKPLELNAQSNALSFNNCRFVSYTESITLINCEGLSFNTCDISNNQNEIGITISQSLVEFNNCYFENLNANKTIVVNVNETVLSRVKISNCLCSSSGMTIIPGKCYLEFNNTYRGNISIGDRSNSSTSIPAVDLSLADLQMPLNYYASKNKALYYFDGHENPNFATIGTDPDKSVVFNNGTLSITFPNNTSSVLGGLAFSNLEQGKKYMLIMEGDTPNDDDNLSFFQYGDTYSIGQKINSHNNRLIIPFTAHTTNLYIRWTFTGTLNIRKLIIQESKNYI